jgi:uncharacterized protein (TIGR00369 family)
MTTDLLATLESVNQLAAFNRWAGFEVARAETGLVELRLPWRDELGQYTGFLHAGMVSALVDTACGFAAFTATGGPVLASSCDVRFLAPATGEAFVARARVVKAGRRQVFASAELFAEREGQRHLVACGETLLVPTGG